MVKKGLNSVYVVIEWPHRVDDQLSHDESVRKYVMMNNVNDLLPANPAGP